MRITQNSQSTRYLTSLFDIQARFDREQQKLNTGKNIQRLSDGARQVADIQQITNLLDKNDLYKSTMNSAAREMESVEISMEQFGDKVFEIRQLAIDGSKHTSYDKLPVFGQQVYQLLTDLVNEANHDFGGKFAYAGTKTTPESIVPTPPATNTMPFELVKGTPSTANPSGLQVVFKGNTDARQVLTAPGNTEQINLTADKAFGGSGTAVFDNVIKIYNLFTYRQDGTARTSEDIFSLDEQKQLQGLVKDVSDNYDSISESIGTFSYKRSRLEALAEQTVSENTLLKELRSQQEDTNIPESLLKLKKEENALQYSLQVGSKLFSRSLLDFLG
jgi:flagellar hook-associated protein 3 FlgL